MSLTVSLPRSTPEQQGISSQAVLSWLDAVQEAGHELHSFMLLRSGLVLAEGWWAPYQPGHVHRLHSLSKSFVSTAVGCLVAGGQLSVEDHLLQFFPESVPEHVSDHLAAMRVIDLLTMRTGHHEDVMEVLLNASDDDWVRAFLAEPVRLRPGTHFVYSSAATFMLSALVQRLSGQTVLDFLRPRLLQPLGIDEASWVTNPQGISVGGWGLHLNTEALAKVGQLYLQQGRWADQTLLPEAWIETATRAHVPADAVPTGDWSQGYGFQFWRCRHGAYRADGAFEQFYVVLPQQQAVLVITASVPEMQPLLDQVWTHLLPGFTEEVLPEDPAAHKAL